MKPLSLDNLENYLTLRKELTSRDSYVLPVDQKKLEEQLECHGTIPKISLLELESKDVGFIEIDQIENTLFINNIFISPSVAALNGQLTLKGFEALLQQTKHGIEDMTTHQIKYIGPLNRDILEQAFENTGFKITKEHIQMEKPLSKSYSSEQGLNLSPLSHFKDTTKLHDIMKNCMSGSIFNYSKDEVAELTRMDNSLALMLWVDSQPAGFVIVHINAQRNKQQGQQVVYIEQIAISPAHRNQRLAGKLLEVILSKSQSQTIDIARLHVYSDNPIALNLYRKLGFVEVKRIGHWVFDLM